jgi:hypothetical protein
MSSQLESIYSDELILLAETLGEVKTRTEKLEGEFSTHAKPLEAATNALSAALSGIKALQFHVLDNNLGALSARVEEMRKAVDEQVGVIALELKKADETNAAKAGADAEALRSEIVALQSQLGSLVTQFGQQLERVEFAAKEEAKKLQLIPGPAGAAGASLNPRGTFIDGEVYNRLDVVSWLGSSYIATVDGVTEKPSKNSNQWQTLASRGGGGGGGVGDFGSLAGVAQINQGGTGQTTRAAALNALLPSQTGATQYILLTDGAGTVSWGAQPVAGLPSQTSNSGKLLTTNGTNASWSNAVTVSGSNATVTGTLTVNTALSVTNGVSANELTCTGGYAVLRGFGGSADTGALYLGQSTNNNFISSNLTTMASYIANTAITSTVAAGFRVLTTTASTSTSTGALVVGNGTSGGLGVGGNIHLGGDLNLNSASGQIVVTGTGNTANSKEVRLYRSDGGDWAVFGLTGTAYAGSLTGLGNNEAFIYNTAPLRVFVGTASTNRFDFTSSQFKINATTASTSTSSGALVVSGGVGVAGASTFGATVTIDTAGGMLRVVNSNSLQPRGLVSDNVGNFENSGTVHLRKARGTESAKTAVLAGDSIGNVAFSGWDGTAYQLHEGIFQVRAAENFGTGHYGTYMQWQLIKANTGYTVYEAMRLTDSGNLLLGFGDNPTEGTGRIQLAAGASGRASGLGFANDTWLYRSGANTLAFDTSGSAAVLNVRENGTLTAAIGTVTGDLYLQTQQAGKKVYIKTANAATAATFDENQKATFAATIKTAAPTGGTAAEWKLGTVATVSPTSPNRTIEVDIGGTIYYLAAKTTNN